MGGGQSIRSLMPGGLIDEYLLLIHPLVLGSGRRLFEHDGPADLNHIHRTRIYAGGPNRHYRNQTGDC